MAAPNRVKASTEHRASASLVVSERQRGNQALLSCIRNVPLAFAADVGADFHVNQVPGGARTPRDGPLTDLKDVGVLYLELRYHMANPGYVLQRLGTMPGYKLRVLLLHRDLVDGADGELVDLAALCIARQATLLVGWSHRECGRYIETFKAYEHKGPELIRGEHSSAFDDVFARCLTVVRSVNKADVLQLGDTYGTMRGVVLANADDMVRVPGLGTKKVMRLQGTARAGWVGVVLQN